MLRPTESPTLFLQQLGRGLRKAKGKAFCTVLDFVGTHRKEFRFDRRYRALLGGTRRDVERAVQMQFPFLPVGCNMQLDEKAAEVVLRSLREAIPSRWPAKVDELRSLRRDRPDIDLAEFLDETGLDLDDLYAGSRSWSDLLDAASAPTLPAGPERDERCAERSAGSSTSTTRSGSAPTGGCSLRPSRPPSPHSRERSQAARCTCSSRRSPTRRSTRTASIQEAVDLVWAHPQVLAELRRAVRRARRPGRPRPPAARRPIPTRRCRSTPATAASRSSPRSASTATEPRSPPGRAACTRPSPPTPSCSPSPSTRARGGFSPTTRYRDYAISRTLIHWESQSIHPGRQPHRSALPQPRARRPHDPAVHPPSQPTTGRSGSSARPPTEATSASGRWPSPGSSTSHSPATSTRPSPPRSRSQQPSAGPPIPGRDHSDGSVNSWWPT